MPINLNFLMKIIILYKIAENHRGNSSVSHLYKLEKQNFNYETANRETPL